MIAIMAAQIERGEVRLRVLTSTTQAKLEFEVKAAFSEFPELKTFMEHAETLAKETLTITAQEAK